MTNTSNEAGAETLNPCKIPLLQRWLMLHGKRGHEACWKVNGRLHQPGACLTCDTITALTRVPVEVKAEAGETFAPFFEHLRGVSDAELERRVSGVKEPPSTKTHVLQNTLYLRAFTKIKSALGFGESAEDNALVIQRVLQVVEETEKLLLSEHGLGSPATSVEGETERTLFFNQTPLPPAQNPLGKPEAAPEPVEHVRQKELSVLLDYIELRYARSLADPYDPETCENSLRDVPALVKALRMAAGELTNIVNADFTGMKEDFGLDANRQFRLWAQNRARDTLARFLHFPADSEKTEEKQ